MDIIEIREIIQRDVIEQGNQINLAGTLGPVLNGILDAMAEHIQRVLAMVNERTFSCGVFTDQLTTKTGLTAEQFKSELHIIGSPEGLFLGAATRVSFVDVIVAVNEVGMPGQPGGQTVTLSNGVVFGYDAGTETYSITVS